MAGNAAKRIVVVANVVASLALLCSWYGAIPPYSAFGWNLVVAPIWVLAGVLWAVGAVIVLSRKAFTTRWKCVAVTPGIVCLAILTISVLDMPFRIGFALSYRALNAACSQSSPTSRIGVYEVRSVRCDSQDIVVESRLEPAPGRVSGLAKCGSGPEDTGCYTTGPVRGGWYRFYGMMGCDGSPCRSSRP